jgi:hypothetical protein
MIVPTKNDFELTAVDPAFAAQRQAGEQPTAPACDPSLPVRELVPLNPAMERIVGHAGSQTDWKSTRVG